MKNSQRGSASIIIIIILISVIIVGGFYLYSKTQTQKDAGSVTIPQSQSVTVGQIKIQPKAPTGYLTPDTSSIPTGYAYLSDYGTSGTTVVYTYQHKNFRGLISFTQMPSSYSKYVSDFTSPNRTLEPEKTVKTFNTGVVLEAFKPDGSHESYRLIHNNSGKIVQIYAKDDSNITPDTLQNLLQRMY